MILGCPEMRIWFLSGLLLAPTGVLANKPEIDPTYSAIAAAIRELPAASVTKGSIAVGELLVEHFERESDGARFFVTGRASANYPSLGERAQFAAQARPALDTLKHLVPDGSARVRGQPRNAEFVVLNNFTRNGGGVAVFMRAPDWDSLTRGTWATEKGLSICPVNVGFVAGNGQPAAWVGQEASAEGQAQGTNGLYYEFELRWIVTPSVGGTLVWSDNGGTCEQIDNPIPDNPPPDPGATGGSGGTGPTGGGGVPPVAGGGIPSLYYIPPVSYICGPRPDGTPGTECSPT
jgi:hypothetical protein